MKRILLLLPLAAWLSDFSAHGAAPLDLDSLPSSTRRAEATPDPEFLVHRWQTSDGLPVNVLQDLRQTPDGFLWIGTSQGLVRFDGIRFELFFSTPTGVRYGARAWPLETDSRGRLWIGLDHIGISILAPQGLVEVQTNGLLKARAESLCSDGADGMYWVDSLGRHGRLSISEPEQGVRFKDRVPSASKWMRDYAGNMWLQTPRGLKVLEDGELVDVDRDDGPTLIAAPRKEGGLWVAHSGRLRIRSRNSTSEVLGPFPWLGTGGRVTALLEDKEGRLWIGTAAHGLYCLKDGQYRHVLPISSSVLCLFEDSHGAIWLGTRGGGLIQVRKRHFFVHDLRTGLRNEFVNSLAEDKSGRMWIASAEGNLSWRENGIWHQAGPAQGWPQAEPVAVTPANDGGVFVATAQRDIWRFSEGRFTQVRIPSGGMKVIASDLLHDRQGRLWMVTDNDGIFCFDGNSLRSFTTRDGLPSMYMRVILEEDSGDITAGDWEGGVVRLKGDRWEMLRKPSGHRDAIRCMAVSGRTRWIGTSAGGLLRFKDGQTARLTVDHGLPDACIQQLLLDKRGFLWGGTPHKLFKLPVGQLNAVIEGREPVLQPIIYGLADGVPATSFGSWNDPRCWRTADAELWFATANGAIHFMPDRLPDGTPPQAIIEHILLNNRPADQKVLKRLRPSSQRIEFRFTAPALMAPDRIRYRYRLSGVDSDWVDAGASRSAIYASIPPGEHTFQVVASSPEGTWGGTPAAASLAVHPFFWQTTWFWAALAAVAAGTGVWGIRRAAVRRLHRRLKAMRQEQAVYQERARIAQDIHDELGANLTSIGLMADMGARHKDDPIAMGKELQQISETARESVTAMDAIVWALNPKNDSLDHFANYLAQFSRDFFRPSGIRTRLELPDDLPRQEMGTELRHQLLLIVKEAFNNVVRHARANEVRLELACRNGSLHLVISDNGTGLPDTPAGEGQDGLLNLQTRIGSLGGTMKVETSQKGTRLDFSLPLGHSKTADL